MIQAHDTFQYDQSIKRGVMSYTHRKTAAFKTSKPSMPGIDFMGTEDQSVPTQVAVMRGQERSGNAFDLRAGVIPYQLKQSTHTSNAVLYQH